MAKKTTDKRHLETWESFRNNIAKSTPVDLNESQIAKRKRIEALEADPEKWFAWYFPSYYTAKPAPFHIAATKRIVNNPEWLEVRSWSRELAKSARTMMEALYLSFTKKKKVWLMISNTEDNAKRLLLPYKNILESNNRIINDYGVQRQVGKWEDHEFTTKFGFSFRSLGAGQSPRGTRNDAARPDGIIIDDFDTDEKCRNKDRVKADTDWIQEAVIPTRSVSVPLLVLINGNIIHKYCTITIMGALADVWEVINLTDKKGNPTWLKNTKEMIRAMFYNIHGKRKISKKAEQKEYYNNPTAEGDTLTQFLYGKCPPLKKCEKLVTYIDPSPSNNKEKKSSSKAVAIVGLYEGRYYCYKIWLGKVTNSDMVNWIGQAYHYLERNGIDTKKMFIENNSLQGPHFDQVIKPLLEKYRKEHGIRLPVREDKRKKADKFERLENMKDDNDNGDIIFNEKEKENPMMIEMEDEWLGVSEKSTEMDGPDAFEGAKTMIDTRVVKDDMAYASGQVESRRY